MEDKKRYDRIQHAPYSLDLAPFDFAFFPQLKSNLHGKWFSDFDEQRAELDLKKRHGLVMGSTTQEILTNPGRVFEKLCRSPNSWRYSPLASPKVLRISLHDETLIAVKLVSLIRMP